MRRIWVWLALQMEAFDDNLVALDDDVASI